VQPGEEVTLYFTVKNVSEVDSFEVQANIQNKSGAGVLLHDGRFQRDSIPAGAAWVVPFTFQVLPEFKQTEAALALSVIDTEIGAGTGQNIKVPIYREKLPVQTLAAKSVVSLKAGTEIHEWPGSNAPVVAIVEKPIRLLHTASAGSFERVNLGAGRPGWVAPEAIAPAEGQVAQDPALLDWMTVNASPEIDLAPLDTFVTSDDSIRIRGKATDAQRVRDLYVSTSRHKVYYESNQGSANPRELDFDAEVPLHPGMNSIMVVAREDNNSVSRHYFMIRRDAPDGSLMETTQFEGALLSNGNGHH